MRTSRISGLLRRGWRLLLSPLRLYRQRFAVQLVVSHVFAVLLAIALFFGGFFGALFWAPTNKLLDLDEIMIDFFLGEQARTITMYLDPDALASDILNGPVQATDNELSATLNAVIDGNAPGFDPTPSKESTRRLNHIAIINVHGTIVATSDPNWVIPGQSVTTLELSGSREAFAQSSALNGTPDPDSGTLYTLRVSEERTSATYPIITSEGEVVGFILLEGNPWSQVFGQTRSEVFTTIVKTFISTLWIFAIPALLVSIPFGIWRGRTISSRLGRLAGAADAMAEGNLNTRIKVTRHDEVGRLAERFNEMGDHIERSEQRRRAFISNVSHELRTPVSIIQGTAERELHRPSHRPGHPDDPWEVVTRETSMLSRLIGDLFTLTRVEEHNLRLERSAINLAEVAEGSIAGIRELAWSQSRVSIESLISRDLPSALADPTRVRQIINNLVHNALRHTPAGGLVVLQASEAGKTIQISTSDTGRGIPEEDLPNVFDRYYQSERGVRHSDTSGLGLSVVKQLVEAHGGTITVESVVGQGTTFRFTLPKAPA